MKRREVLFQRPTHHKKVSKKNAKLAFQEFIQNLEIGGPFERTWSNGKNYFK